MQKCRSALTAAPTYSAPLAKNQPAAIPRTLCRSALYTLRSCPSVPFLLSKQARNHCPQNAQRPSVFQALGGLVELLQRELGVFEKSIVVNQLAHRTLALIDLQQDGMQVGHGASRLLVEAVIRQQFADGALPCSSVADDLVGVGQESVCVGRHAFDFAAHAFQIADRALSGNIQRVLVNQFAHRPLPLRDAIGHGLDVADGGREVGSVIFDEICQRPEQAVDLVAAETAGEIFQAGGSLVEFGEDLAQVGLLGNFQDGAIFGFRRAGAAELDGHVILRHQASEADAGLAVGPHIRVAAHDHGDIGEAIGQEDVLHAADVDAGLFHIVTEFEVLHVFEQGVKVETALEETKAAEVLQEDQGQNNRQSEEQAQLAFNGFFHNVNVFWGRQVPHE